MPHAAPVLPFEPDEYRRRLTATRAAMAAAGVELLIVSDPSNMAWLSGYDGWSFYVHQCVVIAPDGEPLWFGRLQDANGARRTSYLADDNIVGYPDHLVQNPPLHPFTWLAEQTLPARGWERLRIGVEMDNYYFSARAYQCLQTSLPDARFIDATGLVNWQRAVKSPQEIAYMRAAGRIVARMHEVIAQRAEPGLGKNELVGEILRAGALGVDGYGGDYPAIVPLLPSGADASAPHLTWDDRPLRADEATFFEIAGCYRRYHCPLSRTLFFGRPPQKLIDADRAVLEGLQAGLAAARAGNVCEDIANAFFSVLARNGIEKNNRAGYSIGMSYPPDWGERTMSLRAGDRSELRPGMTFHFMTGLWMDDWGLETTESILITDGDAEPLADVPRRLLVK